MKESWSSIARAVMSLVLVTMLVLGLQPGAIAASGPDDDCVPTVHATHDIQHAYRAAARSPSIVVQPDHTKPGKAGGCCRACSQALIAPASSQAAFTAARGDAIPVTADPEHEQAGSRGLRRPPRALLTV